MEFNNYIILYNNIIYNIIIVNGKRIMHNIVK